jgi:hypothetical protein
MIIYSGDRGSAGDDRSKLIGVLVLFKPSEFTPDWEEQGEDFNANFEKSGAHKAQSISNGFSPRFFPKSGLCFWIQLTPDRSGRKFDRKPR